MNEELPALLKEHRLRLGDAKRKLTPADYRELTLLDTGNAEYADQIENELLLQEAGNIGQQKQER